MTALFREVARPETGCLAYVVGDPETRLAAVVDPPDDAAGVELAARDLGVRVVAVVETHTHADHLSGARALARRVAARLVLPEKSPARFPHETLVDGQDLRVGDLRIRALATPGHTPDATTLVLEDRAFVGDTLLPGSPGRADFYAEGPHEMYHSIFDRLLKLSDELALYASHYGPKHGLPDQRSMRLGEERRASEALSLSTKEDFVRYMTEGWPPKPHGWEAIVEKNTRA